MKAQYLFLSICTLFLIGCAQEVFPVQNENVRIFTTQEIGGTRVGFAEEGPVTHAFWEIGDEIGIYTKDQRNLKYIVSSIENGIVQFSPADNESIQNMEGQDIYVYYPFSDQSESKPPVARIESTGFSETNALKPFIYAKGTITAGEAKLHFQHPFAYIKLILTKDILPKAWNTAVIRKIEARSGTTIISDSFYLTDESFISGSDFNPSDIGHDLSHSDWELYLPFIPQQESGELISISVSNDTGEIAQILNRPIPHGGLQAGHIYVLDCRREDILAFAELQRQALIALYNATDGDNWYINTNWCSEKPIYEWYGVNHCFWNQETIKSDLVVSLFLAANHLIGHLPEEFSCLMDSISPGQFDFNLSGNGISGEIPSSILNHSRWGELGWGLISQNPYLGDILQIDDYNLKMTNREVTNIKTDTPDRLHHIFSQNEYTIVYNISVSDGCLRTVDFTQERVNMHLDYHNKGLTTVFSMTNTLPEIKNWMVHSVPDDVPDDILYISDIDTYTRNSGDVYILDRQGNLVYHLMRDYAIEESWYNQQIKNKLRSLLGEPEEHPLFEMEDFYTSKDYSKDGEILTLQKAGKGKGIDLVFMGDAYIDTDMESGGVYEQAMKEGMEKLFSIEPYKSLRDRFNVYAVKVVSPNNLYLPGTETRINWEDSICFEYAEKIPGLSKDRMMICVLFGSPGFWRNVTNTYTDGSFVSYITKGIDDVLIHEVGGHGIAKLKDEYVEPGFENEFLSAQQKNDMDTFWELFGWGANVDWRNDPATVRWSHFLNDERYKNEGLGIYEGAYLYGNGAYRPTENSMMRYNDAPFNAPSREQIYKAVMQLSEGDGWTYDYEEFVVYDAINRNHENAIMLNSPPTKSTGEKREKTHTPPVVKKGAWNQYSQNR